MQSEWKVVALISSVSSPSACSMPLGELVGGVVGVGQREDALGRDALRDQPLEAARQRARLAGAGAGDDQQRTAEVRDGGAFCVVQTFENRLRIDGVLCGVDSGSPRRAGQGCVCSRNSLTIFRIRCR